MKHTNLHLDWLLLITMPLGYYVEWMAWVGWINIWMLAVMMVMLALIFSFKLSSISNKIIETVKKGKDYPQITKNLPFSAETIVFILAMALSYWCGYQLAVTLTVGSWIILAVAMHRIRQAIKTLTTEGE